LVAALLISVESLQREVRGDLQVEAAVVDGCGGCHFPANLCGWRRRSAASRPAAAVHAPAEMSSGRIHVARRRIDELLVRVDQVALNFMSPNVPVSASTF